MMVESNDSKRKQPSLDYQVLKEASSIPPNCQPSIALFRGLVSDELSGSLKDFSYLFSSNLDLTLELSCCKFPRSFFLLEEWENNKEQTSYVITICYLVDNIYTTKISVDM